MAETQAIFIKCKHQIEDHKKKLELVKYADTKSKENKLFETGMEMIISVAKGIEEFKKDHELEKYQLAANQMNKTADDVLETSNLILDSLVKKNF